MIIFKRFERNVQLQIFSFLVTISSKVRVRSPFVPFPMSSNQPTNNTYTSDTESDCEPIHIGFYVLLRVIQNKLQVLLQFSIRAAIVWRNFDIMCARLLYATLAMLTLIFTLFPCKFPSNVFFRLTWNVFRRLLYMRLLLVSHIDVTVV